METKVDTIIQIGILSYATNALENLRSSWKVMWMAEYKDITELKKQIADFKKAVHSPNGDYLTGYVCALSATEGIIAGLPDADVVEVVRCKDCKHAHLTASNQAKYCDMWSPEDELYLPPDFYCAAGERKDNG